MSNILSPIVARYSLFFTLALSDSSWMAKSKRPRQEVHERVFQAQERFQTRYHVDARKLRALIRNVSTASSSSTSTQSSQSSASSSSPSTSTTTSSSSSTDIACNNCCQSCSSPSSIQYLASFPIDGKDDKCSNRKSLGVGSGIAASAAAMMLPSPPPSPLFYCANDHDLPPVTSSPSSAPSSTVRSQLKTRSTRTKAEKVAQRRRRSQIASIGMLLSIALTVIFLSLLQNRRQGLRKKNRLSSHRPHSRLSLLQSSLHSSQQDQARLDPCTDSSSTPSHHQRRTKLKSCNHSAVKRRRHNSNPQIMSTSALDAVATDHAPSGQTKDTFLTTWQKRRDLPEKEEQPDPDYIQVEELSFLIEYDVMDSSSNLDPDEEFSYSLEQQHVSGHLYHTYPSQTPAHLHRISFDTTSTRLDDHLSYSDPIEQYQMFGQYIDPALQLQHYRLQHYPYVDHHVRRHFSVPPSDAEPSFLFAYGPPIRSAHELAWERHNYYQRLQQEEEELALSMRQERLQRRQQEQQRQTQQDSSSIIRTGSVNRLASPSLLSQETSRALGICRSNTLVGATEAKNVSSVKRDVVAHPATFSTNFNDDETTMITDHSVNSAYNFHLTTSQTMPVKTTTPAAPALSRKKTLKEHLSPSLRSLARHCSSRFSGGSNGAHPNSFLAVKSDPIPECPQEEENSRAPSSQAACPVQGSARMTDFKPLRAGPEMTEILKQSQQQQQQQQQQKQHLSHQRWSTVTGERVRVHRRKTLFRSNSVQVPSSTLMTTKTTAYGLTTSRADTFPIRKNNSLRLANSRGLDLSTFFSNVTPQNVDDALRATPTASETLRRHMSTSAVPTRVAESRPSSPDLQAPDGEVEEEEEYGSMLRKQIASILSLGRKSSNSKKTTPVMSESPSLHCLSPLAVEAQESLPDLSHQQQMTNREENEDDYEDEEEEEEEEEEIGQKKAMEDQIAFMLVPKSRYEFQPLVVQ